MFNWSYCWSHKPISQTMWFTTRNRTLSLHIGTDKSSPEFVTLAEIILKMHFIDCFRLRWIRRAHEAQNLLNFVNNFRYLPDHLPNIEKRPFTKDTSYNFPKCLIRKWISHPLWNASRWKREHPDSNYEEIC